MPELAAHLERVARDLAPKFHEAYERLAPQFGYETRKDSAVPWEQVPERNRKLMTAVCKEVVAAALAACARESEKPLQERIEQLEAILNTPELDDFAKGVALEAKHQRARWGDSHDMDKEPEEWFWVVGYLAGKGLQAQRAANWDKFKHHLITGAAILANWHARALERAVGEKGRA